MHMPLASLHTALNTPHTAVMRKRIAVVYRSHIAYTGITLGTKNNMKNRVWQDRLAPALGAKHILT
jgi:hypothetical protein